MACAGSEGFGLRSLGRESLLDGRSLALETEVQTASRLRGGTVEGLEGLEEILQLLYGALRAKVS